VYGVYCEQVTKLQVGRELRQSVIHPGRGSVCPRCWTSGYKLLCSLLDAIVVKTEIVENLGLITVHISEICAARDGVSA
jgi:hypothetical protein